MPVTLVTGYLTASNCRHCGAPAWRICEGIQGGNSTRFDEATKLSLGKVAQNSGKHLHARILGCRMRSRDD